MSTKRFSRFWAYPVRSSRAAGHADGSAPDLVGVEGPPEVDAAEEVHGAELEGADEEQDAGHAVGEVVVDGVPIFPYLCTPHTI